MRFRAGDEVAITQMVEQFERQTAAELVIVVEQRSTETRHLSARIAAACSLLIVAWNIYMPWPVSEAFLLLDACIAFVFVSFLCESTSLPLFILTRKQRWAGVHAAAQRVFTQKKVASTRERIGLLIYISLREQSIEVLADSGIHAVLLREEWEQVLFSIKSVATAEHTMPVLQTVIDQLGFKLGQVLPRKNQDLNELADSVVLSH